MLHQRDPKEESHTTQKRINHIFYAVCLIFINTQKSVNYLNYKLNYHAVQMVNLNIKNHHIYYYIKK